MKASMNTAAERRSSEIVRVFSSKNRSFRQPNLILPRSFRHSAAPKAVPAAAA